VAEPSGADAAAGTGSARRPLRTALVGYGLGGRVLHRPLLQAEPGLEITHVVTRDPVRRGQAAEELPHARLVGTTEELWQSAEELDLVVVASANPAHVPVATAALELGLATVVDKPLALTSEEAERLCALARERDVPLTVFHNRRWDSEALTAAQLLEQGTLGELLRLESRFTRYRPELVDRWREDPAAGGGVLLDLGSHLVDQALHLLGPVVDVYAEVDARRAGARVDDDCFLALRHASGARSHLWCSMTAPWPGPRMVLQGLDGAWEKAGLDGQEDALREAGEVRPVREPDGRLRDATGERAVPSAPGDWPAFYRAVVAAVHREAPVPVAPEDAVRGLQVLEAAREAARTGQVTPVAIR